MLSQHISKMRLVNIESALLLLIQLSRPATSMEVIEAYLDIADCGQSLQFLSNHLQPLQQKLTSVIIKDAIQRVKSFIFVHYEEFIIFVWTQASASF